MLLLTSCQARAARAMLRWSIEELAAQSKVSVSTIRRIERQWGVPQNVTTDVLVRLQIAFEREGIAFLPDDRVSGPGVRFGRYPGRRT